MLSISDPLKSVNQISAYYLEGKDDYYLNGTAVRGRWAGSAASELGLGEFVQPGEFLHSLSGFSPDGKTALVQNAGDPNRVSAWDFTFSAPKDASIVWAMLPEKERAKVEIAHRKAVDTALECAEVLFASTRRGKGGKFHERGKLLAATFEEFVSRAQDMQIHTHCVLFNTVLRKDGTAGALHSINLFRAKKFLGAVYQSEFAFQLGKNLGFKIRPERVGFGIDGIPDKIRKHYSKRRAAIQAEQKNHGLFGAIAAKIIARNTRPKKDKIAPSKLFSFWQGEGRALGWGKVQAHALVQAATFEQGHPHSIKEALFSCARQGALTSWLKSDAHPARGSVSRTARVSVARPNLKEAVSKTLA